MSLKIIFSFITTIILCPVSRGLEQGPQGNLNTSWAQKLLHSPKFIATKMYEHPMVTACGATIFALGGLAYYLSTKDSYKVSFSSNTILGRFQFNYTCTNTTAAKFTQKDITFFNDITHIKVNNTNGPITVTSYDKPETLVTVTAHATRKEDLPTVLSSVSKETTSNKVLFLKYTAPRDCINCWVAIHVQMPKSNSIYTENKNDETLIQYVKGNIEAQTENGNTKIIKAGNNITIKQKNGNAFISQADGAEGIITLSTQNSGITMQDLATELVGTVKNGNITMKNCKKSARVRAKIINGRIAYS